ncbi:hypothetical protein JDV02_001873 [Purpureocillium takamizusanense]|uniref:Uncharacterized protein n=1 Tax=Purpureocillium takamizusanense TaxID=2060973 RepID=A0A9Q8V747_9HYPO|nr:uncharacterized protein JDV02_001873 [Purpureocillium takamizusanense]UNI15333.1 hypothetical protein JDV02_001873 [Purpureocillium takamizusanense]
MSGNDFHVLPSISGQPAWEAMLRLENDGLSIAVPLRRVAHPSRLSDGEAGNISRAVQVLRVSWPDASTGPSRRRQLGPEFDDAELPSTRLFSWLASKHLNPVYEGFFVDDLFLSRGRLHIPLRQETRGVATAALPEDAWKPLSTASSPRGPAPDAQLWSFTGPDPWVISLPVFCAILLLMVNPTKQVHKDLDCPDRELSWCLDSMQGFCREKGLDEGDRCLAWSLGTFPDCWTYLHFTFHVYLPDTATVERTRPESWPGSGVMCPRGSVVAQIGHNEEVITFAEDRFWIGMRTATSYGGNSTHVNNPQTVAFVVSDTVHFTVKASQSDWDERGLKSPEGATGIALFQMLLMVGIDRWSAGWDLSLKRIDELYTAAVRELGKGWDTATPPPCHLPDRFAERMFRIASVLNAFQKHIDTVPTFLQAMAKRWQDAFPGKYADLCTRFDGATQAELLDNWSLVMAHAAHKHAYLSEKIDKRASAIMKLGDSALLMRLSSAAAHP